MKTVAHLLADKGNDVYAVAPSDTVYRALELMAEKGTGAVVVMDGSRLVGILSERDYARKVILKDRNSRETAVADIMTSRVSVVSPDRSVEECMALMTDMHIRHLPVVDGDEVVGVVSVGDVVKAAISEREFIIAQLERYISGG
jgi:CBS domain-containing protein